MPLDMIPENLDFDVIFEPTKGDDKKYVIDGNTGKYIAVVGKDFNCASHGDFFRDVSETVTHHLTDEEYEKGIADALRSRQERKRGSILDELANAGMIVDAVPPAGLGALVDLFLAEVP